MPRKNKPRRICTHPIFKSVCVNPQATKAITLSIDEYECIRLIDFEQFTQDECAKMMDVARTTVQAIYASARHKLSQALVLGYNLVIDGGDVVCCEDYQEDFKCRKDCQRHYPKNGLYLLEEKRNRSMRVAVTYNEGQIFQHFGRTQYFKIYDVQEGQIVSSVIIPTNGQGHGALGGFLQQAKVDALICGGIGNGARQIISSINIDLYPGVSGDADEACRALIDGTLSYQPDIECHDHDHNGHDCGSHCH